MSEISVRSIDGRIQSSGLRNDQLPAALRMVLDECDRQYGDVPVEITIQTWDMAYGDILPDALVMAMPRGTAWNAQERLMRAREAMR